MNTLKKPICVLMSLSLFASTSLPSLQASMNIPQLDDAFSPVEPSSSSPVKLHIDTSAEGRGKKSTFRILYGPSRRAQIRMLPAEKDKSNESKAEDIALDFLSSNPASPNTPFSEASVSPNPNDALIDDAPSPSPHISLAQEEKEIPPFRKDFLNKLNIKQEDLVATGISLATLDQLLLIEMTSWNSLRWADVESFLGRAFTYPVLDFGGIGHTQETLQHHPDKTLNSRTWLHGSSLPLQSKWTLQKVLSTNAFIEGVEFATLKGLDLVFSFLLAYQIVQPQTKVLDVLRHGSTNSVLGLASQFHQHPELCAVFTLPILWGLTKGITAIRGVGQVDIKSAEDLTTTLRSIPQGKWVDYGRWFLPSHPFSSALNPLEHCLLWEGRPDKTSPQTRKDALSAIIAMAKERDGFSSTAALTTLYHLAYGLNFGDLGKLKGPYDDKVFPEFMTLKATAFEALRDTSFPSSLAQLYQAYYLWSLGQSPSFLKVTLPTTAFKGGRLAMQAISLVAIIETILEYLNCPEKPGLSFTGYQPWSSDYTQECFDELVRQFNQIPGQPADTLTDVLPQYYFPTGTYSLDLSDKGIEADVIADILKGFQQKGPTLAGVNLSGNNLLTPEEVTQTLELLSTNLQSLILRNIPFTQNGPPLGWGEAIAQRLQFPNLRYLDLSNNKIAYSPDIIAIFNSFQYLPQLTALILAGNVIANIGSPNSSIINENLKYLPQLSHLDFADNGIGYQGYDITSDLGKGLQYLSNLKTLNLSFNGIDSINSEGSIIIGNNLRYTPFLTSLDLSYNCFGCVDSLGTTAIGQGLQYLSQLTSINFTKNRIGSLNTQGEVALANNLRSLTNLQSLQMSSCYLGVTGSQGTEALGRSLAYITELQSLDLSNNGLGTTGFEGIMGFSEGLSHLQKLQNFQFNPFYVNFYSNKSFIPQMIKAFNQALSSNPSVPSLLIPVYDQDSATQYLQALPLSAKLADLSGLVRGTSGEVISFLLQSLGNYPSIVSLNLSRNAFECVGQNYSAVVAIGEGLQYFPHLTFLDLSIGCMGNQYDSISIVALGKGLQYLPELTYLNLSDNAIGFSGSLGVMSIGENFYFLPHLTTLDFSTNNIGLTGSLGTVAIGQGLQYLSQLTSLDLSRNYIGARNSNGTVAIGQGLQYLPQLTSLDLSQNKIGVTDALGEFSIGKSLPYLQNLKTFNVANNLIGSTGPNSSLAILTSLPQLPNLITVNLQGMTNINWTDAAQALSTINNKNLQAVCESQLCQGTAITPVKQSQQPQVTSSATSLQAPWIFDLVHRSVQGLKGFVSGSYDSLLGSIGSNLKEVTTNSPSYFPNIQSPIINDWQPVEGTIRETIVSQCCGIKVMIEERRGSLHGVLCPTPPKFF